MKRSIQFFTEDCLFEVKQKKLLRQWISETIAHEKHQLGNINIVLCSDKYLHKMNVEYLSHDTFTDIITFDYVENNTISGDLFISIERIKENSKNFSDKLSEELHRVMIHGVLHLCGFGDKTKKEKEKITDKENIYLSRRPLRLRVT